MKEQQGGQKILITGKGRCNVTNNCSMEDLMANIPGNGKFLYSSLNKFNNIGNDFENYNVPLRVSAETGFSDLRVNDKEALIRYAEGNRANSYTVHL